MSSAESPTTATTTTITTTTTNNNNNSMIPPPVTTTPVGTTPEQNDHDDDASDAVETATKGEKGRFLPRVRILLSKDNEGLLSKLVEVLEHTGCAAFRSAAIDNPWSEAFERFYDSVEVEFGKPTGKNRIHKFRSKVVDMWARMELEIESGEKSPSDPIYSTAMRQWSVHQSVMKNNEEDGGKYKPPSSVHTPKVSLNVDTPGTAVTNHAAAAASASASAGSSPPTTYATTEAELERIRKTVLRLERTMVLNGWAQPKLPSPLNELHYLKEQMPANQFDLTVREIYQREITKYMLAARHQARHSNAPAHLPGILDGLDALRTSPQPMQLSWSLKETYDYVLRAYLKLLEPSPATESASARKRKRDETASNGKETSGEKKDDDEKEEINEESHDEEMDATATV